MFDPPNIRHPERLYIAGEWVTPKSGLAIVVTDPTTEQAYLQVAAAGPADMDRAIAAARGAFDNGPWPWLSYSERAEYLRAIADHLDRRLDDVVDVWPHESGILRSLAKTEVSGIPNIYRYYARLAATYPFSEPATPTGGGEFGMILHEPVGVVGAIIPWNSPLILIAYKVAPALLAGCTVILKSSPEAPGEGYVMAEIAEAVGLPPGVLNVVTAERAASEALVTDKRVDKITFTGSTAAGRRIASLCGNRVARYTLELGGKSAAVLLDDYDIADAARTLANAECTLAGQICSSLTRIIVPATRHDEMVDALSAEFERVIVGNPLEASTQIGPLATKRQHDRVLEMIERGIAEGAVLATGGKRPAGLDRGYFIEPAVFGHVSNHHAIAQEEIFGPVLSVIPSESEDEAVRIANDSIYGLNASVFTNNVDKARRVAGQLRSGTVGHNAFRTDFGIGAGGFKQSGVGREGGRAGLAAFLESKTIILEGTPSTGHAPSAPD